MNQRIGFYQTQQRMRSPVYGASTRVKCGYLEQRHDGLWYTTVAGVLVARITAFNIDLPDVTTSCSSGIHIAPESIWENIG